MPGFNLGNHGLEAGTVEVCSTVSIVRKMLDIVKAVFASVIFQILFLIQNAVRFTLQFIISGKPNLLQYHSSYVEQTRRAK